MKDTDDKYRFYYVEIKNVKQKGNKMDIHDIDNNGAYYGRKKGIKNIFKECHEKCENNWSRRRIISICCLIISLCLFVGGGIWLFSENSCCSKKDGKKTKQTNVCSDENFQNGYLERPTSVYPECDELREKRANRKLERELQKKCPYIEHKNIVTNHNKQHKMFTLYDINDKKTRFYVYDCTNIEQITNFIEQGDTLIVATDKHRGKKTYKPRNSVILGFCHEDDIGVFVTQSIVERINQYEHKQEQEQKNQNSVTNSSNNENKNQKQHKTKQQCIQHYDFEKQIDEQMREAERQIDEQMREAERQMEEYVHKMDLMFNRVFGNVK